MNTELETGTDNQIPEIINPYPINKSSFFVQDIFEDDGVKFKVVAEYRRLDASNLRVLLTKEEETNRRTEALTKNRTREKLDADEAHENFFNSTVLKGKVQAGDAPEEEWTYTQMCELNTEQKISLNVKFLESTAKIQKIVGSGKYDFLLKRDGYMIVEFLIGDPDHPTWRLLLKTKRPPQGRRSQFRENFAYEITDRGGDLPISRTFIDISSGIRFLDEHFVTVVDDPNYSPVHFLKEDGTLDHVYRENNEEDRKLFIQFFNPHFKTGISGTLVAKFSKASRES